MRNEWPLQSSVFSVLEVVTPRIGQSLVGRDLAIADRRSHVTPRVVDMRDALYVRLQAYDKCPGTISLSPRLAPSFSLVIREGRIITSDVTPTRAPRPYDDFGSHEKHRVTWTRFQRDT